MAMRATCYGNTAEIDNAEHFHADIDKFESKKEYIKRYLMSLPTPPSSPEPPSLNPVTTSEEPSSFDLQNEIDDGLFWTPKLDHRPPGMIHPTSLVPPRLRQKVIRHVPVRLPDIQHRLPRPVSMRPIREQTSKESMEKPPITPPFEANERTQESVVAIQSSPVGPKRATIQNIDEGLTFVNLSFNKPSSNSISNTTSNTNTSNHDLSTDITCPTKHSQPQPLKLEPMLHDEVGGLNIMVLTPPPTPPKDTKYLRQMKSRRRQRDNIRQCSETSSIHADSMHNLQVSGIPPPESRFAVVWMKDFDDNETPQRRTDPAPIKTRPKLKTKFSLNDLMTKFKLKSVADRQRSVSGPAHVSSGSNENDRHVLKTPLITMLGIDEISRPDLAEIESWYSEYLDARRKDKRRSHVFAQYCYGSDQCQCCDRQEQHFL
ncbi:hypothetical protein V1512DRAFT_71771 [Lipomyces arxii]|uniref:uncharacterized protein n=1 Tax=Lipomyces arxii TaxID=56418 RepID=UPI0034CF93F8